MTDEPSILEIIAGPYRGQRLTMSKAEAEAAIAEKWAIDPNVPRQEGEPMTDEQRAEIVAKAGKALRKLRGEAEPQADFRDMTAEKPAPYVTKAAPKK
jgi:hypothetical protein